MPIFPSEIRVAARSLRRSTGLSLTVILTLALGIGANAAIFTLIRGVLFRPLANRDEDRLLYIRQTSQGVGVSFSVPEIADLSRVKSLGPWGDFSALDFTLIGLGEPRSIRSGVVGGSYFQVMGLRPVLGRLLDPSDDGPNAAGAVVLTYRFWTTSLKSDPTVIGKKIRLDSFEDARPATVVGVLEPSVPYPQETQIIANIVTSSHHLSATMNTSRLHRMTDLFARLAPGATLESARTELRAVYDAMKKQYPGEAGYPANSDFRISAVRLRDELTSGARTILLVLMAGSLLIFVIACSNVANLILARTIRRENELGIRVALGASTAALRRTLLTESLLLCSAGAVLGIVIANPLLRVLTPYISRYSVRALDLSVDSSMLYVGAALALIAAALLAFIPRLPSTGPNAFTLAGSPRVTLAGNRKLKIFAVVQIAASFVLVTAAGATVKTLLALQAVHTGLDMRHVLAIDVPVIHEGRTPAQVVDYYREAARRIRELPGVQNVAVGGIVPWRDTNNDFTLQFGADGRKPADNEEPPRAASRIIAPGYFATLGVPLQSGRDFTDSDRPGTEPVAIISQSLAAKVFPGVDPIDHHVAWTDPIVRALGIFSTAPVRVIGVVADMDDLHLVPKPTLTIYRPFEQEAALGGGDMFIQTAVDPYTLVTPVTKILRGMSADQPVERAATLEDVRAEVLSPERLNVIVSAVFAGVAMLIAVVGVAGVLAFSVSGRIREFGIRLAVGSQPRNLLFRVMLEGAAIAAGGLAVGFGAGYWLAQLAGSVLGGLQVPGVAPIAGAAFVLLSAAVIASVIPAAKAARVDVIQALRTE